MELGEVLVSSIIGVSSRKRKFLLIEKKMVVVTGRLSAFTSQWLPSLPLSLFLRLFEEWMSRDMGSPRNVGASSLSSLAASEVSESCIIEYPRILNSIMKVKN